MVVEIYNAKATYSVKQLTADCVDETSVHHGFNVDSIIRCIDVCHWLSWEHSYTVVILEVI